MAKKKKYYVVWEGIQTGIFESWADCQIQIKGYPNARYKSFENLEEATYAFRNGYQINSKKKKASVRKISKNEIIPNSWSVDAACSGNPGDMEYRGVWTEGAVEIFKSSTYKKGTNNIGEFLAIVHALALLKKMGNETMVIYTDSKTAMAWVRNKKVKTTLTFDTTNSVLKNLLDRGELWLKNNSFKNPIIKWETKSWGEIPADFGRK